MLTSLLPSNLNGDPASELPLGSLMPLLLLPPIQRLLLPNLASFSAPIKVNSKTLPNQISSVC